MTLGNCAGDKMARNVRFTLPSYLSRNRDLAILLDAEALCVHPPEVVLS